MNTTQFSIREAKVSDIPLIIDLIHLKAQFDGCPESVEATPQRLEETLFGQQPLAFILLAHSDGNPVGFATYHRIYSTFLAQPGIWLDDLFIKVEYRRRGIGEALIERLCQEAQQIGGGRIDWTVAVDNSPAIQFYEKMGAKVKQVRVCRLDRQAIARHTS